MDAFDLLFQSKVKGILPCLGRRVFHLARRIILPASKKDVHFVVYILFFYFWSTLGGVCSPL